MGFFRRQNNKLNNIYYQFIVTLLFLNYQEKEKNTN